MNTRFKWECLNCGTEIRENGVAVTCKKDCETCRVYIEADVNNNCEECNDHNLWEQPEKIDYCEWDVFSSERKIYITCCTQETVTVHHMPERCFGCGKPIKIIK